MAWPPVMGLVSPDNTIFGAGPVRLALLCFGRLTEPPSMVALWNVAAVVGADTLSSVSLPCPPLYRPRKKLAEAPAGRVDPDAGPSTKALLTVMSFSTTRVKPLDAEWNCSVGAFSP